ncbi:phage distal tail protein [Tepidibacter hydrothermalis]|uniref:Phage tail family protein n=1 Tax=Tepidibacter hydrothermalis TaxID=3036126 RepID=A0ABY8EHC6_9FIRM|nr:phage tail domain-containing protein [Tepidibacter hydrothermalis]WFD12353.1 phage tail family protein [Tepidibacter hydrothermalis]
MSLTKGPFYIEIGNQAPFILKKILGLDGMNVNVQTKKAPFQLGKSYIDSTVDERLLSIYLALLNDNEEEKFRLREQLLRVFNPLLGQGTLKYIYGRKEKEIKAAVSQSPKFNTDDIEGPDEQLETVIHLVAADPFLLDTFNTSKEMSYLMGGLKFGLKIPTTFSYRGFKNKVMNDGEVETPVHITFYGPAKNPKVTNVTTGEFIGITKELKENEKLIIDTSFDNKLIEIEDAEGNRKNALGYIDLASVFWSLDLGLNILSYTSNNDSIKTKVSVKWKNRYTGV